MLGPEFPSREAGLSLLFIELMDCLDLLVRKTPSFFLFFVFFSF